MPLLDLPGEIFDIVVEYVQLDKASAIGGVMRTKRHLFQLLHTSKSLRGYLLPKWDSLTIRINGLGNSNGQSIFDKKNFELCIGNDNVAKFVKQMVRQKSSMDQWLWQIQTINVFESTPYTWGDCSSTIALVPGQSDFVNVKQSHLFSWLLTMGLKKSTGMGKVDKVTIQRVDSEGIKEREPLAKIFGNCSALELFVMEFGSAVNDIWFSTSTAFQIADVELCTRVTSLSLNSSSFELIKRNMKRKLVNSLPKSLKMVRLDVDRVEAGDLISLLKTCDQLDELQITVTMLYNARAQRWVPPSVKSLRIHDRSKCPVPRAADSAVVCGNVEQLVIVAASGFNLVGMEFTNVRSLILLDSVVDKQLYGTTQSSETNLAAALQQSLRRCTRIEALEYGHSMHHFLNYIPSNILESLEKLRYSWYYTQDTKYHIMMALRACPKLRVLRTKYEPEIDALAFATLLWLFVKGTNELCDIILNTSLLPSSNVFYPCTSPSSLGYILNRRAFQSKFGSVELQNLDRSVHYY